MSDNLILAALGAGPALIALGLLAALFAPGRMGALLCAAAGLAAAALFAMLAGGVGPRGARVAMGPWLPPIGQEVLFDAFTAAAAGVCAGLAALAAAFDVARPAGARGRAGLTLAAAGAGALAVSAQDLLSAFLWLGLANLALAAAAALGPGRARAALAGEEVFAWRGVGLAAALLGLGLLYGEVGRFDYAGLAAVLTAPTLSPRLAAALALLTAGLLALSGAAPLYGGAPRAAVRGGLPWIACAMLVGVAGVALSARLAGVFEAAQRESLSLLLALAACLGLAGAALQAVSTRDLGRLVAHAFALHLAGALLSAAAGGTAGAVLLPVAGALSAGGLAAAATLLSGPTGDTDAVALAGAGRARPWAGALAGASLLCAIGAPLTMGFAARLDLAEALAARGWLGAVGALVFASLLGVAAAARWFSVLFAPAERTSTGASSARPPRLLSAFGAMMALAMLVWGVTPPPAFLFRAADALERQHGR